MQLTQQTLGDLQDRLSSEDERKQEEYYEELLDEDADDEKGVHSGGEDDSDIDDGTTSIGGGNDEHVSDGYASDNGGDAADADHDNITNAPPPPRAPLLARLTPTPTLMNDDNSQQVPPNRCRRSVRLARGPY